MQFWSTGIGDGTAYHKSGKKAGLDSPTEQESEGESIFTILESEGAASTVVHDQAEHVVLSHDPIAWQPVKRFKRIAKV
jgi:hypothetical protein